MSCPSFSLIKHSPPYTHLSLKNTQKNTAHETHITIINRNHYGHVLCCVNQCIIQHLNYISRGGIHANHNAGGQVDTHSQPPFNLQHVKLQEIGFVRTASHCLSSQSIFFYHSPLSLSYLHHLFSSFYSSYFSSIKCLHHLSSCFCSLILLLLLFHVFIIYLSLAFHLLFFSSSLSCCYLSFLLKANTVPFLSSLIFKW